VNTLQNEQSEAASCEAVLIPHVIENHVIMQRASDGYVNATAMCSKHGKLIGNYSQMQATKDYLSALSADIGFPISELFVVRKGGIPAAQGTWVHPRVAIDLARWCSPSFAVWVDGWVHDWMKGQPAAPVLDMNDPAVLRNALRQQLDAYDATCLKLSQAKNMLAHVTAERNAAVVKAKTLDVRLGNEIARSDMFEERVAEMVPAVEALDQLTTCRKGLYSISEVAKHIDALTDQKVSLPRLFAHAKRLPSTGTR